jgi:hypothetical protein
MAKLIEKDDFCPDNDACELTTDELVEAFQRIRDPEVRASIIALVTRLAETSYDA